jgi:small GTP-binding protein
VLEGHTGPVNSVALSADGSRALSGSGDNTVRVWDMASGKMLRVLEGHTGSVYAVALSADGSRALSGSGDNTVRVWDVASGKTLRVLEGHMGPVLSVALSADGANAYSAALNGVLRVWNLRDLPPFWPTTNGEAARFADGPDQLQYTNAKVLLVGESGAGKTGLSMRLALNDWEPSDSTVGAWATHWKLPVASDGAIEREIWLWDFGGQADQRLIHQLYMEETALAVLVFDGQKEDVFETLGQWDRDLARASRKEFSKLLVAARVDAGGLRVSRSQVESFAKERGYPRFLETSAKVGTGCDELKEAILHGIRWENIPWRTSPRLFKRLREEIIRLKDEGRVLMRFNELRDSLQLRMAGESEGFSDEELKAVIGLLAGPGAVWELKFGSWVLLQPERINAYAQAVIQTLREDRFERGCIPEEKVLAGALSYQSSAPRLPEEEERIVLLAMHQALVERALCLREHTPEGTLLIFPSYYRRERPELTGHPAVLVSYRFQGFLDDVYATLVVRLHHANTIENDELWRYAADFKTLTGKKLGVKLTRLGEGAGELDVYFDPAIPIEEKIIFSKYVHEHVMQKGKDVVRLRHYVCPHCGTEVGNREVAMKRLNAWLEGVTEIDLVKPSRGRKATGAEPTMICAQCEKRFPLWDEMEQYFASADAQQKVRELREQAQIVIDNESKERALVGEVISTVAMAGQLSREFNVSDHGIDMEIEFKNDAGQATGRKLYLQLKSGDSYLRERKRDGAEIFRIKEERHAEYWREQAFPVLLVIRTSDGEVRWMEIRDYLKRESEEGKKAVKQIVFRGERFDVMSVRRWRDKMLDSGGGQKQR